MDPNTLADMLRDGRARPTDQSDADLYDAGYFCLVRILSPATKPETVGQKIAESLVSADDEHYFIIHNNESWSSAFKLSTDTAAVVVERMRNVIAAAIDKAVADDREIVLKMLECLKIKGQFGSMIATELVVDALNEIKDAIRARGNP